VVCCGFGAVSRALPSPLEMAMGCAGVLRMEWCRGDGDGGGGGDVDVSGQPCLHWLPSWSLDSDLASRRCDCADACALCSDFSHVSVLLPAWSMGEGRCRVRDVQTDASQRVAPVTMSGPR
jgi:hypothetical protein